MTEEEENSKGYFPFPVAHVDALDISILAGLLFLPIIYRIF